MQGEEAMASVLHEWQVLGHRYRLCRWGTRMEGWSQLEPFAARWALRAPSLGNAAARGFVFDALQGLRGWLFPERLDHVLEREVEARRLVVFEQPIASMHLGGGPVQEAPEVTPRESRPERAWVDILVIDDSEPAIALAGTRFQLRLPDRSTHEGVLDGRGRVFVDDIEPGKCWLELTELAGGFNN